MDGSRFGNLGDAKKGGEGKRGTMGPGHLYCAGH